MYKRLTRNAIVNTYKSDSIKYELRSKILRNFLPKNYSKRSNKYFRKMEFEILPRCGRSTGPTGENIMRQCIGKVVASAIRSR